METLLLMGEPGSGKTSIMRRIIQVLGPAGGELRNNQTPDGRRLNFAYATVYPKWRVAIFGKYDGSPYDGTDRMGRNTQPCAEVLLMAMAAMPSMKHFVVLIEGDRLTTPSFIETAEMCSDKLTLMRLVVSPSTGEMRRAHRLKEDAQWLKTASPKVAGKPRREGRSSGQDATWLAGRMTKLDNIANRWTVYSYPNDTRPQQTVNWERLYNYVTLGEFVP